LVCDPINQAGNGSAAPVPPTAAATPAPKSPRDALADPKVRAQINQLREKIHTTVGQAVLTMAALPRYRHQSFNDLQSLVVEPLLRDRVVVASQKKDDVADPLEAIAGIAIWATVSDEVDARIREQVKARVFPVKLKPEDWNSGDKAWLLDVMAPTPKLASLVLTSFSRLVKTGELNVHPVAARQVDPDLLRKLAGDAAATP
jgi:cytolysin-activating lysine-acyltransferase